MQENFVNLFQKFTKMASKARYWTTKGDGINCINNRANVPKNTNTACTNKNQQIIYPLHQTKGITKNITKSV